MQELGLVVHVANTRLLETSVQAIVVRLWRNKKFSEKSLITYGIQNDGTGLFCR